MLLMSADAARGRQSITVYAFAWRPGSNVTRGRGERSVACIARLRRLLRSVDIDMAAGLHATDITLCRDALVV